jgi:hypothetical protein
MDREIGLSSKQPKPLKRLTESVLLIPNLKVGVNERRPKSEVSKFKILKPEGQRAKYEGQSTKAEERRPKYKTQRPKTQSPRTFLSM